MGHGWRGYCGERDPVVGKTHKTCASQQSRKESEYVDANVYIVL